MDELQAIVMQLDNLHAVMSFSKRGPFLELILWQNMEERNSINLDSKWNIRRPRNIIENDEMD